MTKDAIQTMARHVFDHIEDGTLLWELEDSAVMQELLDEGLIFGPLSQAFLTPAWQGWAEANLRAAGPTR